MMCILIGQMLDVGAEPLGQGLAMGPMMQFCFGAAVICVIGLFWAWRTLGRCHRCTILPGSWFTRLWHGQRGTASLEFTIVTPFLLAMILILIQTMLVMTGNLYVHYAAFAATRAAIVQIPSSSPSLTQTSQAGLLFDPANVVTVSLDSAKYTRIRDAAIYALVPICGSSQRSSDELEFVRGLGQLYASQNVDVPVWVERLAGQRLGYAKQATRVALLSTAFGSQGVTLQTIAPGSQYQYSPHESVTVQVVHAFYLSVPYAKLIFGYLDDQGSLDEDNLLGPGKDVSSLVMRAHYTLTNAGVSDLLPGDPAGSPWYTQRVPQ